MTPRRFVVAVAGQRPLVIDATNVRALIRKPKQHHAGFDPRTGAGVERARKFLSCPHAPNVAADVARMTEVWRQHGVNLSPLEATAFWLRCNSHRRDWLPVAENARRAIEVAWEVAFDSTLRSEERVAAAEAASQRPAAPLPPRGGDRPATPADWPFPPPCWTNPEASPEEHLEAIRQRLLEEELPLAARAIARAIDVLAAELDGRIGADHALRSEP